MPDNRCHTPYFSDQSLTQRLLNWLLFRHSLSDADWQGRVAEQFGGSPPNLPTALHQWLQQHPEFAFTASRWPLLLLAAVIGAVTIVGACSYSGAAPVNLWLLLGLFAFLPLLMTAFSLYGWRSVRRPAAPLPASGQLLFRSLLSRLSQWQLDSNLLKPWLIWRLQWLAMAFQLGAIGGFLLLALFQDLAFAWSSTLLEPDSWMNDFLVLLSSPWSWLLGAPSEELLNNSHFYRTGEAVGSVNFDAELLGQWWSYIAMAMLVYGLIPRLLLALWMGFRIAGKLQKDIDHSGDLVRFRQALQSLQTSPSDINDVESRPLFETTDWRSEHIRLAWQWQPQHIPIAGVLGLQGWQQEKNWLTQQASSWDRPIALLVTDQQVPTAELADVILVIQEANPKTAVELWFLADEQQSTSGARKSWQLFARKQGIGFSERTGEAQ